MNKTTCQKAGAPKACLKKATELWYVLQLDGIAAGAFGSWKAGDAQGGD